MVYYQPLIFEGVLPLEDDSTHRLERRRCIWVINPKPGGITSNAPNAITATVASGGYAHMLEL